MKKLRGEYKFSESIMGMSAGEIKELLNNVPDEATLQFEWITDFNDNDHLEEICFEWWEK